MNYPPLNNFLILVLEVQIVDSFSKVHTQDKMKAHVCFHRVQLCDQHIGVALLLYISDLDLWLLTGKACHRRDTWNFEGLNFLFIKTSTNPHNSKYPGGTGPITHTTC